MFSKLILDFAENCLKKNFKNWKVKQISWALRGNKCEHCFLRLDRSSNSRLKRGIGSYSSYSKTHSYLYTYLSYFLTHNMLYIWYFHLSSYQDVSPLSCSWIDSYWIHLGKFYWRMLVCWVGIGPGWVCLGTSSLLFSNTIYTGNKS